MPKIVEEHSYDGATEKVSRLGLKALLEEVRSMVRDFDLRVVEKRDGNGGAAVRDLIDQRFAKTDGWQLKKVGGVDWTKCVSINGTKVCAGVEIQMSARSDLIVIDLIHLRKAISEGQIDLAILVVPSDVLGYFLTDRGPKMSDAKRHVREARVEDLPILLIAIEHDGTGPALAKRLKRTVRKEDEL